MGYFFSTDGKDINYKLIFIIIDYLTKMIHFKPIITITDVVAKLKEIIIDVIY